MSVCPKKDTGVFTLREGIGCAPRGFDSSLGSILCIQILAFTSWYIFMYSVQSPVHVSLGRE